MLGCDAMTTHSAHPTERRLAAILAADVVGYSRLIGADEEGTLSALRTQRATVIDPAIAAHRGRLVKTTGDGLLVEFQSVVDALRCAIEWQAAMPEDGAIAWRIGINVGDVVVEDGDIFGDGVNVAARLEGLAEPGGICVSARVQEDAAGRLDLYFEDMGQQSLKNIARPVRAFRVLGARASRPQSTEGSGETPAVLSLPDKPSIAVLPFQNMSGDPEQEYFVDGMVEEIITALSRIRWLFVIARNSTFTYKGQSVDVKQVGHELGVRYVLEGSVRKGGSRVRITAQLIEADSGAHLWADRFDGSLEDVFDLQDQVARSVAGVIEPTLQAAETERSVARPTRDLSAYDAYLRAYAMFWSSVQVPAALRLLEEAIGRDPNYGPALAWASTCCDRLIVDGRSGDPAAESAKSVDFARRALEVTRDDPTVLANVAETLARHGEDIGAMKALVDRALALNPNYARGWHVSGILRMWAGELATAIEHIETALRLSPRARVGNSFVPLGFALFLSRRFDEAVSSFLLAIQDNPSFTQPYRGLAACYAQMGRLEDARRIFNQLRVMAPVVTHDTPMRNPEHREFFLAGLRLAMGETA